MENKVYQDSRAFREDIDFILTKVNESNVVHARTMEPVEQFEQELEVLLQDIRRKMQTFQRGFLTEKRNTVKRLLMFEKSVSDHIKNQSTLAKSLFDNMKSMEKYSETNISDLKNETEIEFGELRALTENLSHEIENVTNNLKQVAVNYNICTADIARFQDELGNMSARITKTQNQVDRIHSEQSGKKIPASMDCGNWTQFGLSCYSFFYDSVTWQQALQNCKSADSYLIEINSESENRFIVDLINAEFSKKHFTAVWVGASDIRNEGEWVWEYSRTHLNMSFEGWWVSGPYSEPQSGRSWSCLIMDAWVMFEWSAEYCEELRPFICEKSVSVNVF